MSKNNQSSSKVRRKENEHTFLTQLGRTAIRIQQGAGLTLALLLICGIFAALSPNFLTQSNLLNIGLQSAVTIITATGMTFVIASAGIDLSTGSILALTGVLMAKAMQGGVPTVPALMFGLLSGAIVGGVNGWIIGRAGITPFIATLAMLSVARALALILTEARPIYGMPITFRILGTSRIGPIPAPAVIAIMVAVIGHIILQRTRLGRGALAIGGNEEAARLSGINLVHYKVTIYALAGVTYAIAATIVTARLNAAEPIAGMLAELDAIAAAVIGGTGLAGGVATIPGTVVGALIMAVLRNGLTLLSVQPYYQQLTIGIVIVAAVLLDQLRKR